MKRLAALLIATPMLLAASAAASAGAGASLRSPRVTSIPDTLSSQPEMRRAMIDTAALRSRIRFPAAERQREVTGTAKVVYVVDGRGKGWAIAIDAPTPGFRDAVRAALRGMHASGARLNGKGVRDTLHLTVAFYFEEDDTAAIWAQIGIGVTYPATALHEPPVRKGRGAAPTRHTPGPDDDVQMTAAPKYDANQLRTIVVYPEIARRHGIEGIVELRVLISREGSVRSIRIIRSDNKILERSAFEAIFAMRFIPAMKGKEPVDSWITIPVEFKLDPAPPKGK